MDEKLYQLEILHEITMAIGTSLETEPMLDACVPLMLRRLGCTAAQVMKENGPGLFTPVYTLPRGIRPQQDRQPAYSPSLPDDKASHMLASNGRYHHIWRLSGYGLLLLQRARPLDHAMRREMEAIADKLAAALHACSQHGHIREAEELARVTLQSIGDAVITTDTEGLVTHLNPVAQRLTGWTNTEARGRPLAEVLRIIDEFSRRPVENRLDEVLQAGVAVGLGQHAVLVGRHGEEYTIEDSAAPIRTDDGEIRGMVVVFHDITEKVRMMREIEWRARHDALTGLINRHEFEQRLSQLREDARQSGSRHALVYMDLDQFKVVNDTCGHLAGDELLGRITALLKDKIRETDTLARLGGDEFGLLLEHCPPERAVAIAEGLVEAVHNFRFPWHDRLFHVGASAGVAAIDADSPQAVLAAADTACYQAKENGRNQVQLYRQDDPGLSARKQQMDWVSRLSSAVEGSRLRLYFQHISRIGDGQASHIEILVRMAAEGGSLMPPNSFIPAAERFGMMPMIDRWVLEKALNAYRKRPDGDTMVWSINLSGNSLSNPEFLEFVASEFEHRKVPAGSICFEITESAAIGNLPRLIAFIQDLQEKGCLFALDDFGKGLCSFEYLQNLPVDYLKIDGGFVRNISHNAADLAIVESINRIGHALGIATIAEQVEDADTLELLRTLGVDYAQGYFIHEPQPITLL